MKYLIFLLLFIQNLLSHEQIIFVLAKNFDSQNAKLIRYEKINNNYEKISEPIVVNIGKQGLGWGLSNIYFKTNPNEPIKKEGDKKAVAGIFELSKIYTYEENLKTKMPYFKSTKDLICVDDIQNYKYNQIIKIEDKTKFRSYENMLLKSELYKYVIKIEHNPKNIKEKGSCIFMHIENPKKPQTVGCTSMKKEEIEEIISWLDIEKRPILIQIPKSSCKNIKEIYPFLNCEL